MKKFFVTLYCVIATISITACGSSNTYNNSSSNTSSSTTTQVPSKPTSSTTPQITYETRNNSAFVGQEVYAVGMIDMYSNRLIFNNNEYSLFTLDIASYETDEIYHNDIVLVEGVYGYDPNYIGGLGSISNANVKKASASDTTNFNSERNTLRKANGWVYNSECLSEFDYTELLRGGIDYKDKKVTFSGKVKQIIYGTDLGSAIIGAVGSGTYCNVVLQINNNVFSPEYIIGTYVFAEDERRILEGDYITMNGVFQGVEQMEMVFGTPKSYPVIDVEFLLSGSPQYEVPSNLPVIRSTPVASTPVTSTPVASTPVASTPVASTPVTSTPVASTPVASTPVASTPVTSTPVTSTPVYTKLVGGEIENEVTNIRNIYNSIMSNYSSNYLMKELQSGVRAYYEGSYNNLRYIQVVKGYQGEEYSRHYYFNNGDLIFAFLESKDSHRMYFYENRLFRLRYTDTAGNAVNHEYEASDFYTSKEAFVLRDSYELAEMFKY